MSQTRYSGISYYNSSYTPTALLSNGNMASEYVPSMARQVIPIPISYGYKSLTHGDATGGSGYFPIMPAYPFQNGQCPTKYAGRACTGQFNPASCQTAGQGGCPPGNFCCFDGPNCTSYMNRGSAGTCISGGLYPSVIATRHPTGGGGGRGGPTPTGTPTGQPYGGPTGNPFIPRAFAS